MHASRAIAYLLLILTPLFFSSNLIIGRGAISSVEPYTLAFWRWFLAFLILLPFAGRALVAHRDVIRAEWKVILLLGVLGMFICGAGVYVALHHTSATNATLIYTTSPALILLIEILFLGAAANTRQIIGIVVAFIGVAIIILRGDWNALARFSFNPGDLLIAAAALSWAIYSVILKRQALAKLPTIVLFCAIAAAGALILAPAMLWEWATLNHFPDTISAWKSILGVAVVASVMAFGAYQYGIKQLGPTLMGISLYLLPVYGVTLAVIFLGEQFELFHAIGMGAVTAGIVLATWSGRAARKSTAGLGVEMRR